MPLVRTENLRKTYRLGKVGVPVLRGVDMSLEAGEFVVILGASGSGKSTLLHLIGGLDRPDPVRRAGAKCGNCRHPVAGVEAQICPECAFPIGVEGARPRVVFDGRDLAEMSSGELDRFRRRSVGLVFQFYHLLPELSVVENVLLGAMISEGRLGYMSKRRELRAWAEELLTKVGLSHRITHTPAQLSGGERQRVAIARALVNRPAVLLADEPTGNLDRVTGGKILDLFSTFRAAGQTMLVVTHDEATAGRADRVVRLEDGRVVAEPRSGTRAASTLP
jgi:lipoprotein-releasing system ATP-binding protein